MRDNESLDRLAAANRAAGWPELTAEDHLKISALADEFEREMELYPIISAWATEDGSQLTFWCRYCDRYHFHGRHDGPEHADALDRWDIEAGWKPKPNAVLPLPLWRRHVDRFRSCRYNPRRTSRRGICTCPVGSGDGHRSTHCWNRDGEYYRDGYILHEVHPNDVRALRKPGSGLNVRNRRGARWQPCSD